MLVLLSSHQGWKIHYLTGLTHAKGVQILGHLWSPGESIKVYPHLVYAIENGKFYPDERGEKWDADRFVDHCDRIPHLEKPPLFITVPDQRKDAAATLELWHEWAPRLRKYQVPLAFVLQDGIALEDIPECADALFIGGSDGWRFPRLQTIMSYANAHKIPVHVGRVNGHKLWVCHRAGVASCDGSGWFRGDEQQFQKLVTYLKAQIGEADTLHHDQLNLFSGEAEYVSYALCLPHANAHTVKQAMTVSQRRIPDAIQQEHLMQAIKHWRSWGPVPARQRPRKYAVSHEGSLYPIKLLISRAYSYVNPEHTPLPIRAFSGGAAEANRFVLSRQLQVVSLIS